MIDGDDDHAIQRYQHARARWIEHTDAPKLWWLKQQHDVFMQCFANCVTLAGPVMLVATNPRSTSHWLEVVGLCAWLASWYFENLADTQKMAFVRVLWCCGCVVVWWWYKETEETRDRSTSTCRR